MFTGFLFINVENIIESSRDSAKLWNVRDRKASQRLYTMLYWILGVHWPCSMLYTRTFPLQWHMACRYQVHVHRCIKYYMGIAILRFFNLVVQWQFNYKCPLEYCHITLWLAGICGITKLSLTSVMHRKYFPDNSTPTPDRLGLHWPSSSTSLPFSLKKSR